MGYYVPCKSISKYILDHTVDYNTIKTLLLGNVIKPLISHVAYWHLDCELNPSTILKLDLKTYTKTFYTEILHYVHAQEMSGYIVIPKIKNKSIFKFNPAEIECKENQVEIKIEWKLVSSKTIPITIIIYGKHSDEEIAALLEDTQDQEDPRNIIKYSFIIHSDNIEIISEVIEKITNN